MAKGFDNICSSFGQTKGVGGLKPVKCLIIMILEGCIHYRNVWVFSFVNYVLLIVHLTLNVLLIIIFASFIITKILNELFL